MPLTDMPPATVSLPLLRDEFDAARAASSQTGITTVRPRCAAGSADEIVVCASDQKRYRLAELLDGQDDMLKAQFGLGQGVAAAVRTDFSAIGGAPSNRIMVDLKFKF